MRLVPLPQSWNAVLLTRNFLLIIYEYTLFIQQMCLCELSIFKLSGQDRQSAVGSTPPVTPGSSSPEVQIPASSQGWIHFYITFYLTRVYPSNLFSHIISFISVYVFIFFLPEYDRLGNSNRESSKGSYEYTRRVFGSVLGDARRSHSGVSYRP